MGAALGRDVIGRVHRFENISMDQLTPQRQIRLPKESFYPSAETQSMPFQRISGTSAKPTWYSPSGANWGQRDADLALVNELARTGAFDKASLAWQGSLVQGHYKLIIRKVGAEDWFFPRIHWPDSSVLCIPAAEGHLPSSGQRFWVADTAAAAASPVYLSILDLREWEAVVYTWHSCFWQAQQCPDVARTIGPSLRAFSEVPPAPLLDVLAREAFFTIGGTTIKKLAVLYDFALPSEGSLFELVHSAVQKVLSISAEEALAICRKRIARSEEKSGWCEELCQLDEAVELLERQDHLKVNEERDSAIRAMQETKELKAQYAQTHRKVVPRPKAPASGGDKRKKRGGNAPQLDRIVIPEWPNRDIDLAAARACVPPGGKLWASQRFGNWQAHFEPLPRVSRAWQKYGYAGALTACLEYLWSSYAEAHNIAVADLPVEGLFKNAGTGAPAQGGASGSSSSSRPRGR